MDIKPAETQLSEAVMAWMATSLKQIDDEQLQKITLHAGDGSSRRFYRILTVCNSYILLTDSGWQFSRDYPILQHYFLSHKIPAPVFYDYNADIGCLLMEDLGDVLLQHYLVEHPLEQFDLLNRAIVILAQLHGRTFPVPLELPAAQRCFDADKYFQELSYTQEHLIVKLLRLPSWNGSQLHQLGVYCDRIGQLQPQVFCHRDYHCRNILIRDDRLYLIDFQDARLGSPHYDLASILYDPYTVISEEWRNLLLTTYRREINQYPLADHIDWGCFHHHLSCVGWQRMVKAAGSFASFYNRHGKNTHTIGQGNC
jgi:aminoglycoside/choline kinase family phosphotransferase